MNKLKLVKCRKAHRCEKCNILIGVGEQAYRVNTRDTGPIYRCKGCGLSREEIAWLSEVVSEERYEERYGDLNKRIQTEEF